MRRQNATSQKLLKIQFRPTISTKAKLLRSENRTSQKSKNRLLRSQKPTSQKSKPQLLRSQIGELLRSQIGEFLRSLPGTLGTNATVGGCWPRRGRRGPLAAVEPPEAISPGAADTADPLEPNIENLIILCHRIWPNRAHIGIHQFHNMSLALREN